MSIAQNPIALEALTEREAELCNQARNQMQNRSGMQTCSLLLTFDSEELITVALPNVTISLLVVLLDALQKGEPVTFLPRQALLNIPQASELLGISTPLLSTLLMQEAIPSQQRGLERLVRYEDLLAYQLRREREREQALQEMVAENQRAGFYDDPPLPRKGEAT